jgi:hypothetical protein
MADDVLKTRRLSGRQALDGCGLPTVSTDDMAAEAIPAQLPAGEVLAAAYFAWPRNGVRCDDGSGGLSMPAQLERRIKTYAKVPKVLPI